MSHFNLGVSRLTPRRSRSLSYATRCALPALQLHLGATLTGASPCYTMPRFCVALLAK